MNYNPHQKTLNSVIDYFTRNSEAFPGIVTLLQKFLAEPNLTTAQDLMARYFKLHKKDDVKSLQIITSTFASKALVKSIVDSILEDEEALTGIASRSYPHPIGFDKLVLYDDKETGFKFRLHVYWRSHQQAAIERTHLHRFLMASAIVSGELTNQTWQVADYRPESDLLPQMEMPAAGIDSDRKTMIAYSGYWRDQDGVLHKKILGECDMVKADRETFLSGKSYAQILSDAHYVETNAETGESNGDICSTIYVHSGGLKDAGDRGIPVLFEEHRLDCSDQIIEPIPQLDVATLRASLSHYSNFLQKNLEFYEWLYDPKHGRDLSIGMVAGYLLSENLHDPHTISKWIDNEKQCSEILRAHEETLRSIIQGDIHLSDLSDDDRNKRYYTLLLDKAESYPKGKEKWLQLNGDLVKEMWRYCGALKGEKPNVTVLKPIWEEVVGKKLPGGAHYGHVAAMIDAAFSANKVVLEYFKSGLTTDYKLDGSPASDADKEVEILIKNKLAEYYSYAYTGEEGGSDFTEVSEGSYRWLVDPIDGTRNFLMGRDDFCVSIACQMFKNGEWETTDGVVSFPISGKIYWAERGKGAYIIERDSLENKLNLSETNSDNLKNKVIDISLSGFGADGEANIVRSMRVQGAVYRATGSSAMMLSLVASKGSDGVILTAHDYDIAAAQLIAEEAGAKLSHFKFTRLGHEFQATIAGITPKVNADLEEIARSAVQEFNPS